jgi:hypothetical protein
LLRELEAQQPQEPSGRLKRQELVELPVLLGLQVLRQEAQEGLLERKLMEQQEQSEV